jgi:hypothetical protein
MAVYQGARRRGTLGSTLRGDGLRGRLRGDGPGVRAAYGTNRSATAASTLAAPGTLKRRLPRSAVLPPIVDPAAEAALPRRRLRGAVRAGRRTRPLRLLLGGIVVAFLLAFFSLAQTVRLTASDYEVDRLLGIRDRLEAQRLEVIADLNRLGGEPAIRREALELGLSPLGEPLIVQAR